ncbi:MAG: hypothetical protein ACD_42C00096G0002 [uncultured bacterium]|nr:MAG: hypothetical protein ACD_42C00096G0002 [uncultured bacterium]OGT33570.1 MAG: A/G-specific adenine glycosylase [Gammaproteobacteria bacterium RIFCSPHIGHO2_02_FULL_39_13]OGT49585.1 MAG: A/G-specific adenine glycosylase [Gammaproteobacteria bacterium RIFCSPHIGHO2_12_FULL_39_24]
MFSKQLLKWYEQYGRYDLPWQKNPTAYRVWISEIMLQQTQVTTVIPYYERFMKRFPTIKKLATATEDDVLLHWSGLGYYARARNIYKTAKIITEQYHGHFPETVDTISELPGIGKSTAGAIISFAYQKKAVILDGNVKRVLARYFAIESPINQKDTIEKMWACAEKLTPRQNAHHYNQAIMDLGATLCTRTKPRCAECPFIKTCQAHQQQKPTFYPIKTVKKSRPLKKIRMLIIYKNKNEILLLKRPASGIWGGLWSFPEKSEGGSGSNPSEEIFQIAQIPLQLKLINTLPTITHQFTHFTLEISPIIFRVKNQMLLKKLNTNEFFWYKLSTKLPGGVAAPVKNILDAL